MQQINIFQKFYGLQYAIHIKDVKILTDLCLYANIPHGKYKNCEIYTYCIQNVL